MGDAQSSPQLSEELLAELAQLQSAAALAQLAQAPPQPQPAGPVAGPIGGGSWCLPPPPGELSGQPPLPVQSSRVSADQAKQAPANPPGVHRSAAQAAGDASIGGSTDGNANDDCTLLAQLTQLLSQRQRNGSALLLSDLGALLPSNLRHGVKEKGGLRSWLQKFPQLFQVSGHPGKERVTLVFGDQPPSSAPEAASEGASAAAQEEEECENDSAVQMRGLPYRATQADVRKFLGPHAESLRETTPERSAVELVLNRDGRPSGFARVVFNSPEAARAARDDLHKQVMDFGGAAASPPSQERLDRYVEIFLYSERPNKTRFKKCIFISSEESAAGGVIFGGCLGLDDPEAGRIEPDAVADECRSHMSSPGKGQLLLSMLGVALSYDARVYLKRTDQGLKHFLTKYPDFAVEGVKGRECVTYLPSGAGAGGSESEVPQAVSLPTQPQVQPPALLPTQPFAQPLTRPVQTPAPAEALPAEAALAQRGAWTTRPGEPASLPSPGGLGEAAVRRWSPGEVARAPQSPFVSPTGLGENSARGDPLWPHLGASPLPGLVSSFGPSPNPWGSPEFQHAPGPQLIPSQRSPHWTGSPFGSPSGLPAPPNTLGEVPVTSSFDSTGNDLLWSPHAGAPRTSPFCTPSLWGTPKGSEHLAHNNIQGVPGVGPWGPWDAPADAPERSPHQSPLWVRDGLATTFGSQEPAGFEAGGSPGGPTGSVASAALRLRGLPFTTTEQDVLAFFAKHNVAHRIKDQPRAVHMLAKSSGKPSGHAIVQMASQNDAQLALSALHMQNIGRRYIEVFFHDDDDAALGPGLCAIGGRDGIAGSDAMPGLEAATPGLEDCSFQPSDAIADGRDVENSWQALLSFLESGGDGGGTMAGPGYSGARVSAFQPKIAGN